MEKRKILIGIMCAVACQFIFGFSLIFTRAAMDLVSPMTLLSWRFIVAFAALSVCMIIGVIKVELRGKSLGPIIWIAVLFPFIYFVGETIGISLTSASESAAMLAVLPVSTLLCSVLLLKIMPTKLQVTGIVVTASGIAIVVLVQGLDAVFNPIGYAMLLLAIVTYSLYAVFVQKAETFTSAEKSYVMTALGAAVFTVIALVENGMRGTLTAFVLLPFTNVDFFITVLYLGIGSSAVAFLLYNSAIANIGAARVASFAGISSIVAVIAGVVILQERFTVFQGVGVVLVVGGAYLANVMPKGEVD